MKTILFLLLPVFVLAQNRPNIIFIMADDLGNGEISFNHTFADTPNIDSLFVNGASFSQAYSQPMCTPSRAALMTGVYPWKQSWGRAVVFPWRDNYMEFGRPLLPERMRAEGYTTAMFGKWHLGHIYPEYTPINRGWDYYFGNLGGGTEYDEPYSYNVNDFNNDLQENGVNFDTTGYYTRVLGAKAVQFIEQQSRCPNLCPFFMYVAFTAPHAPEQAPAATIAAAPGGYTTAQKTKWAMIKEMDNEIGDIVTALETAGIRDSTIIIFTSDNGATLLGGIWDNYYGNNTPFQGEKAGLFEGGVRVPLIWNWPGQIAVQEVDTAVHLIDLFPTIIEGVLGEPMPGSQEVDGVNYYGVMDGGALASRDLILNVIPNRCGAVVRGYWKLVNNPDVNNIDTTSVADDFRLYNVRTDPDESSDISGTYPAIVSSLQAALSAAEAAYIDTQVLPITSTPGGWVDMDECGTKRIFHNTPAYLYAR